ncbi:MAG: hypothetical protein ACKVOR_12485 [Flavobacteriales bacterium]
MPISFFGNAFFTENGILIVDEVMTTQRQMDFVEYAHGMPSCAEWTRFKSSS